jgi:thiol-disulfide isomerase/thioredoxin
MGTIQRVTTLVALLLTVSLSTAAQEKDRQSAYDEEMRKGEMLINRRAYEEALQAYKKAYGLKDKASLDAALGMAVAYRGLGAHKNVFDISIDALKLAGDDKILQAKVHNLRGAALVSLSDKPGDKRLVEAESAFRIALESNPALHSAQLNLGVTLLKMGRDDEGTRELKTYVERAPKGPETATALKMIAEPRRAREIFAPDFSFTSKQGEFITLEDLRGRTVVLDFWGTWCKPCLMATPALLRLHKKFVDEGVVFIGVAVRDQEPEWAAYIEKTKMEWPQFLDTNRKIVMPFAVNAYPTYIVIDGDGIVRARKSGYGRDTDSWLEGEIKRTLKKKPPQ